MRIARSFPWTTRTTPFRHRRCAFDDGGRWNVREGSGLVRQRDRLCQPADRAGAESGRRCERRQDQHPELRHVTAAYWAFTLTDGALRMLVLLHFNQLGYTPVQLAFLFLLYEFFGIVTNLVGGWLAARTGLRLTLVLGLALQVVALGLLALLNRQWSMAAVRGLCDGLSGAVRHRQRPDQDEREERRQGPGAEGRRVRLVQMGRGAHRFKERAEGRGILRRWVPVVCARISRRAWRMSAGVLRGPGPSCEPLPASIGQAKKKPKFSGILSNSSGINRLSLARLALFAARDVWFVVSVPIFLASVLGWSATQVGGFMALWVDRVRRRSESVSPAIGESDAAAALPVRHSPASWRWVWPESPR